MRRIILALLACVATVSAHAATIEQFGGDGDGITDNTPALNAAIDALYESGDRTIQFGRGQYIFKSAPATITYGLHIVGQDKNSTILRADFNGGTFFHFTGADGSGGGMSNLALFADAGFAPGDAIVLSGNAKTQPDMWQGEHIYITGPGNWYANFVAYGNDRTTPPQGLREVYLSDIQAFNATGYSFWFANVVGLHMFGGGVYTGSNCTMWITGLGTQLTNSTLNDFIGVDNNCQLNISNSTLGSWIGGEIGSLVTDRSSYWTIITHSTGDITNRLVNSRVEIN